MSLFVQRRDPALAEISDEALQQLTKLLYMDTANYFGDRSRDWLTEQEQQVKGLDAMLLRPRDLFTRFALTVIERSFFSSREVPRLCLAHKALDPKVIRSILQLIADECTIQTNRYRSLRLKKMLSPSLECWMARMDSITALWLREDKFRRVFGCRFRSEMPDCVRTNCEACMLAVIGGSAMHLTDLRASVLARQAYNTKLTGREHRWPRLLRIVNSWISFFQEDCQKAIRECSEAMASDIVEMRTLARRRRDKDNERRNRKGKPPKVRSSARVRLTKEGLPIPRQPRLRKGDRERLARRIEKIETLLSPQETVDEQQKQRLDSFRRPVLSEARHPPKIGSSNSFAQKSNDTAEKTMGSKPDREEQNNFWEAWLLDKDTRKEEAGEEECWVQEYRQLALDSAPSKDIGVRSNLGFSANIRHPINNTTGSWTSKIDDETSRISQVPLLYCSEEAVPVRETASSVYSCDGRVETNNKMLEEVFSMISGFTRDSAAPALLWWMNGDLDATQREGDKITDHETALAMLEGREEEEEAASCYETMGWGGPRKG
ncbi:hypothetical protein TrVFT333_005125 [Trichoderma virens FT-333]|nr:hypothetical protein TrVFT333_005125 [Trichoderma virens FT-333]